MTAVEAALSGVTVLTSTKRLSRSVLSEFQRIQRAEGRTVWRTPPVFPLNAFVHKCFEDWLYSGRGGARFPQLLNPVQASAVWESVIDECDRGRLLQVRETAAAAQQAWDLAMAWGVQIPRADAAPTEDSEAFGRWAARYADKCRPRNWMDAARLTDFVRDRIAAGEITPPARIAIAGFDELTPQERDFLETLRGRASDGGAQLGLFSAPIEVCQPMAFSPTPRLRILRGVAEELETVAAWARDILLANASARMGLIVPELAAMRATVERIFSDTLQPGAFCDGPRPFHISLGKPLAEYPIVHAALLMLRAGLPSITTPEAGLLLRSPFARGGVTHRAARATVDAAIRKRRQTAFTLADLPELSGAEGQIRSLPAAQAPSQWSRSFAEILSAFGWPGDRQPDSAEYQAMQAWNNVLSSFATLDAVVESLNYESALSRLRSLVERTPFQLEDEGAPVQIMDAREAAGLTFDHLWIAGLNDETMPKGPRPNPFLPLSVQRARNMPHSSAERERVFAEQTLARLMASAPDVTLSYARMVEDRRPGASPLLSGFEAIESAPPARAFSFAAAECVTDEIGPPLEASALSGGASLLKHFAECPFKAFARYRLNAQELEDADFGISAAEQGKGVHAAMQKVWEELGSSARLNMPETELRKLVEAAVCSAVTGDSALDQIERERLQGIILRWLMEFEKQRPEFTVVGCEIKRNAVIGGLELKVRVDRMDRLADGTFAIIDYKTGNVKIGCWDGERPAEPQLPLYAATSDAPLGAVLIAQVRRDEMGFRGIANGEPVRMKPMRCSAETLDEQRVLWTGTLEKMAVEFRKGVARVDPADHACDFCAYPALCRIHDDDGFVAEENGDAAE